MTVGCGWPAAVNSEKPRPVLEHRNGASRNRHITITRGTGPVAVSVAGGVARPHLYEVGKQSGPGIDVHEIDVKQLTASLNAIRTRTLAEAGEVTAFTTMIAAMFEQGRLVGLAEAGVA